MTEIIKNGCILSKNVPEEETSKTCNGDAKKSTWINLNVGGKLYTTTRFTLSRYPSSFLFTLCQPDRLLETDVDETGAFLIDRDGKYFAPILNYLRAIYGNSPIDKYVDGKFELYKPLALQDIFILSEDTGQAADTYWAHNWLAYVKCYNGNFKHRLLNLVNDAKKAGVDFTIGHAMVFMAGQIGGNRGFKKYLPELAMQEASLLYHAALCLAGDDTHCAKPCRVRECTVEEISVADSVIRPMCINVPLDLSRRSLAYLVREPYCFCGSFWYYDTKSKLCMERKVIEEAFHSIVYAWDVNL